MQRRSLLIVVVTLAALAGSVIAATAQVPSQAQPLPAVLSSQSLASASALGTAFTYQGELKNSGASVNGTCNLAFHLYDAVSAGSEVGTPLTPTVPITNGLFTTLLDFGAGALDGDARWLAISAQCPAGTGGYTALLPRQALTPAPMALALPGLWTQQNATSPNLIGGFSGNVISSGVSGAVIGGGGQSGFINRIVNGSDYAVVAGGSFNTASGNNAVVGGGLLNSTSGDSSTIAGGANNQVTSLLGSVGGGSYNSAGYRATVAGGTSNLADNDSAAVTGGGGNHAGGSYSIAGGFHNAATGDGSVVAGGGTNQASGVNSVVSGGESNSVAIKDAAVGGGQSNAISNSSDHAFIGAGQNNVITGTAHHAFIGAGQDNVVGYNSDHSVIVGGQNNKIILTNAYQSAIGGGDNNSIAGASWSVIAGGHFNTITATFGTIAGGESNSVGTSSDGTVGGGSGNQAQGPYATVPGGQNNIAKGWGSFAAGQQAQALHDGSFVWADGNGPVFASTGTNVFMARAKGGITFYDGTGNCALPPNGSAWSCSSDRALKTNILSIDPGAVLAKVAAMPISRWSMKEQDPSITHIGPMAQDFYAAFNIGEDNTHIGMLDEGGVALAAIQGLNQVVQQQAAELNALKAERDAQAQQVAALDARVSDQETRLRALEQTIGAGGPPARPADNSFVFGALLLGALGGAGALYCVQSRARRA